MGHTSSQSWTCLSATIKCRCSPTTWKTAFHTHEGHFEFLVLSSRLTNSSATFQSLMNTMLHPFLHKFMLMFFYDILIYSPSWSSHLQHINVVLSALREHQLRLKRTKCSFAQSSVAYLGHVISAEGVAMDRDKIDAITTWPQPHSVRGLRGFLGMAGYYRRFIKDYGAIAAPLTQLLMKEGFVWSQRPRQRSTASSEPSPPCLCCNYRTSPSRSWLIAMRPAPASGLCFIRATAHLPSSADRLRRAISSLLPMNAS